MRALALLAMSTLALGACHKTRTCKAGTVLLSVDWPESTDTIQFVVTIDGVDSAPQSVSVPSTDAPHGTLELDFSTYPAGHMVSVAVTALAGGNTLGSTTSDVRMLAGGCDTLTVTIVGGAGDGGGNDLSGTGGGCTGPSDCPTGQACDTVTGGCTITCSATQPCNGGCCDGTTCAPGNTSSACALGQVACGSCASASAGKACLDFGGTNSCACTNASDCPANQACNTTTHTCSANCDSTTPCNGGCCSAMTGGTCQTGTAKTVCGNNGSVCGDCTNNQIGHVCIVVPGGGQCGCNGPGTGDCPGTSTACTANLCVNTCSAGMPCLSGCCASTTSTCQPGTSQTVCGATGSTCQTCVGNANGSACLASGQCGCTKASDCAPNHACDTSIGRCTTSCNTNQLCNGGCCSAGVCVGGGTVGACGSSGSTCATCPGNTACASYSCNGTSCQVAYAPSSTICNPQDPAECFFDARCTGSSPNCPARTNLCTGGACCTSDFHCTDPCP